MLTASLVHLLVSVSIINNWSSFTRLHQRKPKTIPRNLFIPQYDAKQLNAMNQTSKRIGNCTQLIRTEDEGTHCLQFVLILSSLLTNTCLSVRGGKITCPSVEKLRNIRVHRLTSVTTWTVRTLKCSCDRLKALPREKDIK